MATNRCHSSGARSSTAQSGGSRRQAGTRMCPSPFLSHWHTCRTKCASRSHSSRQTCSNSCLRVLDYLRTRTYCTDYCQEWRQSPFRSLHSSWFPEAKCLSDLSSDWLWTEGSPSQSLWLEYLSSGQIRCLCSYLWVVCWSLCLIDSTATLLRRQISLRRTKPHCDLIVHRLRAPYRRNC